MKKILSTFLMTAMVCGFIACGYSKTPATDQVEYEAVETEDVAESSDVDSTDVDNDGRGGYDENPESGEVDAPDIENIRLTGEIVQCNKCMGYGMVQDGLYGQPEICKFCFISTYMRINQGWQGFNGRYGMVDAVFNTLPADYFDGLDWNIGGGFDNDGEIRTEQIESEIERHEQNIAQLEHQLEYIEGSISRTQIQQQIIQEQYEIRRLKAMLNGM